MESLARTQYYAPGSNISKEFTPAQNVQIPPESDYLRSVLVPFSGPASIPDQDMTTAFPKEVRLTQNFTLPATATGGGLFVYLPHNKYAPVRFYIYANGAYQFAHYVDYDQDLATDFTTGRFVSGGLSVLSATRSGSNFDVSGVLTSTAFQESPDISVLQFNQVTAYKRNNMDVVANAPIELGVTALAMPNGQNKFTTFNTDNVVSIDSILTSYVFKQQQQLVVPPWHDPTLANPLIFSAQNIPGGGFFPVNNFGYIEVEFLLELDNTGVVGNSVRVEFTLRGQSISSVDWATPITINVVQQLTYAIQIVAPESKSIKMIWDRDEPLTDILIGMTAVTVDLVTHVKTASVIMKNYSYYEEGFNGPGTLIAFQTVSPTQTIAVSGVGNYEVVPNAELSKNITTSYFGAFNPTELDLVTHYLAMAVKNGVKFVWMSDEYRRWVESMRYKDHVGIEHLASATGFTDFLSKVWNFGKPLVQAALPAIGGYLGGPLGMGAGTMAADLIDEATGRSAAFTQRPRRNVGSSAAFQFGR